MRPRSWGHRSLHHSHLEEEEEEAEAEAEEAEEEEEVVVAAGWEGWSTMDDIG